MRRTHKFRTERRAHLSHQSVGPALEVSRGEAQESIPGIDQEVLAAVVFNQALAMVATVVLDGEARRGVVKVGPAYKPRRCVDKVCLDFWPRQAGLDQDPAKPSLHRRLRRRSQEG